MPNQNAAIVSVISESEVLKVAFLEVQDFGLPRRARFILHLIGTEVAAKFARNFQG